MAVTRAHLDSANGTSVYPGLEISWNVRDPGLYDLENKLGIRLSSEIKPGDLTKYLSLPWQSDFYECHTHWSVSFAYLPSLYLAHRIMAHRSGGRGPVQIPS